MPGAENIQLDEQAQEKLKALAASRTSAVRLWERATIIMELAAGTAKQEIAKQLGLARQTVLRWEQRFLVFFAGAWFASLLLLRGSYFLAVHDLAEFVRHGVHLQPRGPEVFAPEFKGVGNAPIIARGSNIDDHGPAS